ncbi:MAG: hypothetical protein J7500_18310 [Sphingomonas sp.]|nr:hypothetical protein [Sphingomonas sp.]MBO9624666.1 hypothetical protein [Sphingomonas sp.]
MIDFIVTSIAEFFGWLVYDLWKERRDERRLKREQRKKRNGPIDYG